MRVIREYLDEGHSKAVLGRLLKMFRPGKDRVKKDVEAVKGPISVRWLEVAEDR